jgi:Caspase domain
MSPNKNVLVPILGVLAVGLTLVGCKAIPTRPAPREAISREKAIEIVVEKIAKPSEAKYGLRAHVYPTLLPKGAQIVPFDLWIEGKRELLVCKRDCWFFWLDDDPLAQFAHKTRYVLVDASTGEVSVTDSEWWPVVNGQVVWGKTEERASDRSLIFEKPSNLKFPMELKHQFKERIPQLLAGCEAWIVLVCGSTDVGNTFDEDVQFLYNVFTGLGYPDSHIFYVSPWTTDPGVDRTTTTANVQWAINQVAANSDTEDKVFFFYSSHGGVDSLHCCPGEPGGGTVSSTNMDTWLDTITCRQMTILLQGCHTGSFIGYYSTGTVVASENELTGDGETNRIAITATDTTHSSYGGPSTWGSTFTGGYVESFSDATADVDSSGAISVDEAYAYACDHDTAALAGNSFPHMDPTLLDPEEVFHTCPAVDAWISDGPSDVGNNSRDYDSTDIWSSLNSTGTSHENPVSGLTNYVHVRTHNLGNTPATNVDVKLYWANTSTALAWPADFQQIGATFTIPSIAAGGNVEHTWSWYVDPTIGLGHTFCFVATSDCAGDPMTGGPAGCTYVAPYDNNIAQKNVTIVAAEAGQPTQVSFFIENNNKEMIPFDLVVKGLGLAKGRIELKLPDDLTKILQANTDLLNGLRFATPRTRQVPSLIVTGKEEAIIRRIRLRPMEKREVSIQITPSRRAKVGEEFPIRIEQVAKREVVGANTFIVRIVRRGDCRSTMTRTAELFALIAKNYESEPATRLVKTTAEGLLSGICRDPEATRRWQRSAYRLEVEIAEELQRRPLPAESLQAYTEALKALNAALENRDVEKAMVAQAAVVEAAMKLVTLN